MIRTLPDNTVVEVQRSGKDCPPGFTGQAGNRGTTWFRVNNGEWEFVPRRAERWALQILQDSDTVAEFREMLEVFA